MLRLLFSFAENKNEVNVTLAGYFQKVITNLYTKRESDLIAYVYQSSGIL